MMRHVSHISYGVTALLRLEVLLLLFNTQKSDALEASCNTKLSDLKHSITKVICPANCLKQSWDLCGSDDYATGPLCLAAMHAGLIDNGGGYFEVFKSSPQSQYQGSERNAIRSKSCTSANHTYSFQMKCDTTGNVEFSVVEIVCPFGCSSNFVCGTNSYNKNSSICASAIHAGVLTANGGLVTVYSRNGSLTFVGSSSHEITSQSCGSSSSYFSFQKEAPCTITCSGNGNCFTGINEEYCSCNTKFQGKYCQADFDECAAGTHNCHPNAICNNTFGGFQCACNANYTGNGLNCVPNFCASNPGLCRHGGTCTDTSSHFNCTCTVWYRGQTCETVAMDHKVVTTNLIWTDARSHCQSIGGDLTTWGMRNATIRQSIINNLLVPIGASGVFYWVGLTDKAQEGVWVYLDGVAKTSGNTNFAPGEPNGGAPTVNCAALYSSNSYLMDDIRCDLGHYAICERR